MSGGNLLETWIKTPWMKRCVKQISPPPRREGWDREAREIRFNLYGMREKAHWITNVTKTGKKIWVKCTCGFEHTFRNKKFATAERFDKHWKCVSRTDRKSRFNFSPPRFPGNNSPIIPISALTSATRTTAQLLWVQRTLATIYRTAESSSMRSRKVSSAGCTGLKRKRSVRSTGNGSRKNRLGLSTSIPVQVMTPLLPTTHGI